MCLKGCDYTTLCILSENKIIIVSDSSVKNQQISTMLINWMRLLM